MAVMKRFGVAKVQVGSIAATALAVYGCTGEMLSDPAHSEPVSAASSRDSDGDNDGHRRVTSTLGSSGHIEISDFFIGAIFFADDIIVRVRTHPECVIHIETAAEPLVPAGTMTVTSDFVGTPGGPLAPFVINPYPRNEYFEFPDPPLFNYPDGSKVEVELTGSSVVPPVRATTLRSPPFGPVNITAPHVPDSFLVAISSTAPLKIEWDVPATDRDATSARHSQSMILHLFVLGPVHWAELYCSWPIWAGHGSVPTVLLRALRAPLGGIGAVDGAMDLMAGEYKEIAAPGFSYAVFVTTDISTSVMINDLSTIFRSISVAFD